MTDNDKTTNAVSSSIKQDVPPLWPALANLGAAICAGIAAYESFHMRPAFGWAAGIFICLIIGWLGKR